MGLRSFFSGNSDSNSGNSTGYDPQVQAARRDSLAAACRDRASDPLYSPEERAGFAANAEQYEDEARQFRSQN